MKRKIKKLLARTISPFCRLDGARILYFHTVHPKYEFANSPEVFTKMMRTISDLGKTSHTMAAITSELNNQSISENTIAITFDDGYRDNYEQAFPLLIDSGVTATFYVIAGLIANKKMKPTRQIYDGLEIMTKEQIVEMSNAGMEIGSHTWSHYALRHADKETLRYELETSKKYLEDVLGREVTSFCYPNGEVPMNIPEGELFDLFREIGYTNVTTSQWGCITNQSHPLQLSRQIVEAFDTSEEFRRKLNGNYDYMRLVQKIKGLQN
jgi:peptidoglycan/xylan/chitin deacetylase (PgdA/CDA1 family)